MTRFILMLAAAVSSASLVYEMSIAAAFVSLTGDSVFWQSLTLALYLAALGGGTWVCGRRKTAEPWETLLGIELALCAAGALAVPAVLSMEAGYRFYFRFLRDLGDFPSPALYCATVLAGHGWTLLIGFLSGFELPLLMRLMGEREQSERFNLVLGANYLGALAGCLAFSWLLLPGLGVMGSALAAAAVNLLACAAIMLNASPARRWKTLGCAGLLLAALSVSCGPMDEFFTLNFYAGEMGLSASFRDEALRLGRSPGLGFALRGLRGLRGSVSSRHSRFQSIDLLSRAREPNPLIGHLNTRMKAPDGFPAGVSLFLDRRFQFRGSTEALYHEFLAHVPVQAFRRVPRDVLVLGGGDGLLIRELLKYGAVRSVVNVELDPAMIELARTEPLLRLNERAYDDPRVRVVIDDAFSYVRRTPERFDAVYIDLPVPNNYELTRLYSVEFYTHVGRLLREGGFAAADLPLVSQDDKKPMSAYGKNSVLMSTLKAAGFETLLPYSTRCAELLPWKDAEAAGFTPSDYDPKLARMLRRVESERFLRSHPGYVPPGTPPPGDDFLVMDNLAGIEEMAAFVKERVRPDLNFKDNGVRLHSLTPQRLFLLRFQRFPHALRGDAVNSILRPRLFQPEHLSDFAYY